MNFKKNWKRFWTLSSAREGFTLVELIVVIAILAILAGVAVPAYSGYVKKAERAADEALLNEINTAFASACAINGENHYGRDDVSGKIEDGAFIYTGPFADSFESFYEGGEFKTIASLYYSNEIGGFVEGNAYSNLYNTLKEMYGEDIAKALTTDLGTIGSAKLLEEMNGAMDMAFELNLAGMGGADFMAAYFGYLGFDPDAYDTDEERQAALDAVLDALGTDNNTAMTHAVALYAAQNSENLTIGNLSAWLGTGKDTDDLQANPTANTLAEAAAIYGLYLSYQQGVNGTLPEGGTLEVMTDALSDPDFANWVNTNSNAQDELDAYITYMNLINGAAQDEDAKNAILSNGFKDPELEELLKELLGN